MRLVGAFWGDMVDDVEKSPIENFTPQPEAADPSKYLHDHEDVDKGSKTDNYLL